MAARVAVTTVHNGQVPKDYGAVLPSEEGASALSGSHNMLCPPPSTSCEKEGAWTPQGIIEQKIEDPWIG